MNIIEFDLKRNMFFSTIEKIESVLKEEKIKNYNVFYNNIIDLSIDILNKIKSTEEVSYEQAFILIIALSPYFEEIKNKINQEDLTNELKWINKTISKETGVYFSYIFLNEAYPEINKEIYINNSQSQEKFLAFLKKIIQKI